MLDRAAPARSALVHRPEDHFELPIRKELTMKKIATGVAVSALAVGLSMAGAQAASAATIHEHENYVGRTFSGDNAANVGDMNDAGTSIRNGGRLHYFEDSGHLGRSVWLTGNYNALQAVGDNLHFGETWNDRISSWK